MFRFYFRRVPQLINYVDKHFINTISKKENIIENYLSVLRRSIDFIGIHGPTADEVGRCKQCVGWDTNCECGVPDQTMSDLLDCLKYPFSSDAAINVATSWAPVDIYIIYHRHEIMQCNVNSIRRYHKTLHGVVKDIDLSKKTCLITGANSGIGLEMTRCLSSRDCTVLMACRNPYAANMVAKTVCGKTNLLKLYEINLASLRSVKKCSNEILNDQKKIDIVILNAAVFGLPWTLTEDRLETTFQVNYLSQYLLLMSIEKLLAPDARVVLVSSESHKHVSWDFNHQLSPTEEMVSLPKHEYTSIRAYNISKLCGVHFMHYLAYRWLNTGKTVFCAHPGSFIKTRLCRNWWPYEALYTSMKPFSKSISQAASTPLYCATSPELKGLSDAYYKDMKRSEESDLAQNLHLSFRIHDLTKDLLHDRIAASDEVVRVEEDVAYPDQAKHAIDENTLVANYSG